MFGVCIPVLTTCGNEILMIHIAALFISRKHLLSAHRKVIRYFEERLAPHIYREFTPSIPDNLYVPAE
jgi:hypothetical protein